MSEGLGKESDGKDNVAQKKDVVCAFKPQLCTLNNKRGLLSKITDIQDDLQFGSH